MWKSYDWTVAKLALYEDEPRQSKAIVDLQQKLAASILKCLIALRRADPDVDDAELEYELTSLIEKTRTEDVRDDEKPVKTALMVIKDFSEEVDRKTWIYRQRQRDMR